MSNPNQPESMFKSEGHRVIFNLVEASGKLQQEQLGITRMMYASRTSDLADHWYTNIAEKVNLAECSETLKATALNNLNTLYKQMRGLA